MIIAGEACCGAEFAAIGAEFAAWRRRPRSPMMTVSGIAAEGLPAVLEMWRIAAEGVSPQCVAVLWADTELRFAVIPVIIKFLLICAYKGKHFISSDKQKNCKILLMD